MHTELPCKYFILLSIKKNTQSLNLPSLQIVTPHDLVFWK